MPTYDYPLSLNTISYEAATNSTPLTMTELYGVKFTDGSNTAPSGTIALSDFRLKNVQPYKNEEQLVPSNVTTGDRYGFSITFATGQTAWGFYLFVSSPYSSWNDTGSVHLYIYSGDWVLSPYTITAPDAHVASSGDKFGSAISVDKYANWIAVSAPYWDSTTYTNTGAVYFYERSSSDHRQFTYRGTLSGPYEQGGGLLGYTSTSLSMDSGANYTVVGGKYFDGGSYKYVGRVYLYTRSGSTWSSSTSNVFYPLSSDYKKYLYYGHSVSAKNTDRFIVGAHNANDGNYTNCGVVYVYAKSGSTWSLEQRLVASDRASNSYFGFGVDISEDGNYIIVGAHYRSHQGYTRVGGAYIFIRSGTTWQQQAILNPTDYNNSPRLGQQVHISHDGSYAVVGAEREQSSTGSVHVFLRSGTTWSLRSKVTASDASPNYLFGSSIAISEDFGGKARTLMVGSYGHSSNRGSVYTYRIEDLPVVQTSVTSSVSMTGGIFTYDPPVSISYDGERVAYGSYTVGTSGVVGIFKRNQGSFTLDTTITASDAGTDDQFGKSVSITDDRRAPSDRLLVGAPLWDDTSNNFSNSGAAYLFTLSGGVWTEQTKFLPSDPSNDDGFGDSVAIYDGNPGIYVVSRPNWDDTSNNFTSAGAVYLFTTTSGQIDKLISPNAASNELFGNRIDISQTTQPNYARIVVSASGSEKVYIFRPGTGGAYTSGWYCNHTITEPSISTSGRNFGSDLSISGDGQRLAIVRRGQGHPEVGVVFVYLNNGFAYWFLEQYITPLNDYESNIRDINSVSLSYSGTRLLISDSDRGRAYLYTRDFSGTTWSHRLRYLLKNPHARNSQYGDIDNFGFRVKISGDGNHALVTENYEPFLFSEEY